MTRRRAALLLVVLAAAGLAGCEAGGPADRVGQVDKTRECADLLGQLTSLEFDPRASAARVDRMARQLDRAIKDVDSADVRRAADDLLLRVRRWRDAARQADPARTRRAVQEVVQAAERLARACNVPVDQLTGQG